MDSNKTITCPKCGSELEDDDRMMVHHATHRACRYHEWCNVGDWNYKHLGMRFQGEHMHLMCKKCLGEWATDPLDAPNTFVRSDARMPLWLRIIAWGCMWISVSATSILVSRLITNIWRTIDA